MRRSVSVEAELLAAQLCEEVDRLARQALDDPALQARLTRETSPEAIEALLRERLEPVRVAITRRARDLMLAITRAAIQ